MSLGREFVAIARKDEVPHESAAFEIEIEYGLTG